MPPLLHTHALATLPAFGNLGKPRRPLFGNVANFWQPCHCLEHFRRPILAAPVTPPLRRDRNQPVPHAQPAIGRPPTASCANTSLLPTADCPLPTAHCLLPPTAAVCTRSSRANWGASASPHGSRSCFKTETGPFALWGLSPFRNSFAALAGTGRERTAGEDVAFVWLRFVPMLAEPAWGKGSRDSLGCF